MKHLFVPYEIALQLKEKGFDEPCFGYYRPMKEWMMKDKYSDEKLHHHGPNWANTDNTMYFMYIQNSFGDRDASVKNSEFTKAIENIAVPLWQQAIDWLREEHGLIIDTSMIADDTNDWHYAINLKWAFFRGTYYQAREEAIKEALKLI